MGEFSLRQMYAAILISLVILVGPALAAAGVCWWKGWKARRKEREASFRRDRERERCLVRDREGEKAA